jgi:4-hydroxy-3-methylbut-2-enyl diphosphate reductase
LAATQADTMRAQVGGQSPGGAGGLLVPDDEALVVLAGLRLEALAVRGALKRARVVCTGMGPARARSAAELLRDSDARAFAVVGVCGALDPELRPGDVVVASEVRRDRATRACPSAGLVRAALCRLGVRAHLGPILSADHVVRGGEREALRATGAVAVDMESAWLAEAAGDRPLTVLRVVVDAPGRELLRPSTLINGARALRSLRAAAPALATWQAALGQRTIFLTGPRSFCAGVERAIEVVERALERFGVPLYVRKQIVHNRHVVVGLERRGAVFVDSLAGVPPDATVIFSAHGVSPAVWAEAERRGLQVVDATCPLVNKVHAEARRFAREGYNIVLIGHAGHEEIEGTIGEAPHAVRLVERLEDVDDVVVEDPERVAFLTQTTLAVDDVAEIVGGLRRRFPALVGPSADDICYATQNRQDAVRAVAKECDVFFVVGSSNSSNSNRLVEVATREGCVGHLIDDATNLDPSWLVGASKVGLTAGASAPESLVREVANAIAGLGPVAVLERTLTTESVGFRLSQEVC